MTYLFFSCNICYLFLLKHLTQSPVSFLIKSLMLYFTKPILSIFFFIRERLS